VSDEDFDETGPHEQNIYNIEKRHDLFWFSKVVSDQVFFSSPEKFLNTNFNIKSVYTHSPVMEGILLKKGYVTI